MDRRPLEGKIAVVATKHGKERLVAEILSHELGIHVETARDLDTDTFGTFTGETPRKGSQLDAARQKAAAARRTTPADFYVATEGSFDSDPRMLGLPIHREVVYWHDPSGDDVVVTRETPKTNAARIRLRSVEDLQRAAQKFQFPEHGIILRKSRLFRPDVLYKDARDSRELEEQYARAQSVLPWVRVYAESDLRSHKNPMRQEVIRDALRELATIIKSRS
jgi:hypothetical protein